MPKELPHSKKLLNALKRATSTFERLGEALRNKATALAAGETAPGLDAAQITKDILAHQNAWRIAMDAFRALKDDVLAKGGAGPDGFDFAKARHEVLGRLARLSARSGA